MLLVFHLTICGLPSCRIDNPIYPDDQYGWVPLVSETTQDLGDVFFINNNDGVIVGANGLILKTENAGINWTVIPAITNNSLYDVFFLNNDLGFAAGTNGTIIRTIDGGSNWTLLNTGTNIHVRSIYFCNAALGFAACSNGTVLRTTDGGDSWTSLILGSANLYSCVFSDDATGYVIDASHIYKTQDSGIHWDTLFTKPSEWVGESFCSVINLRDSLVIFTTTNPEGSCRLFKTQNGGASWTTEHILYSMAGSTFFTSPDTGYVIVYKSIFKTYDGGSHWTKQTDVNIPGYKLFFSNDHIGYAVGAQGNILKTTNGGEPGPI